jgi:hypothetical protein
MVTAAVPVASAVPRPRIADEPSPNIPTAGPTDAAASETLVTVSLAEFATPVIASDTAFDAALTASDADSATPDAVSDRYDAASEIPQPNVVQVDIRYLFTAT